MPQQEADLNEAISKFEFDMDGGPAAWPGHAALMQVVLEKVHRRRGARRPMLGRTMARMLLAVVAFAAAMLAHIFLTDAWRDVWPHVATDDGGVHSPSPFNEQPTSERVVFYVEDPNDPIGRRYAGTAKWQSRVELIKPSDKLETVVALEVEIPERDLALALSIRRVADVGSAISHLVEIRFTNVTRAPVDAIARSLGILMKTDERSPGSELIGNIASVAPGVFLFGLSAIDRDRVLNLRLLRGRGWLDIPVIYGDGSRGILAVEKGASGTRVIEEAVGRWERS